MADRRQDLLKKIAEIMLKGVKQGILDQEDVAGNEYPPLKYREGLRMIKTGKFYRNAFFDKVNGGQAEVHIHNSYKDIAKGQMQYVDYFGISDDTNANISKEVDNYVDKTLDDFIDKFN